MRSIATANLGLAHPVGLAFSHNDNAFLVLAAPQEQPGNAETNIGLISLYADPAGSMRIPTRIADPLNLVFDAQTSRLLFLDPAGSRIETIQIPTAGLPKPATGALAGSVAQLPGLVLPQGMAIDSQSGRLYMLDAGRRQIIGRSAGPQQAVADTTATGAGQVFQIDLTALGQLPLRSIAFNPSTGHLYLISPLTQQLYELTTAGELVATRDLAPLGLGDPQAMIFAPSGDPTDDPAQLSLYLADSGMRAAQDREPARGQIVEVTLTPPMRAPQAANSVTGSLVRTIDTSQWSPSSPDPSDITYLPSSGQLLVSDAEVDEMPQYFTGSNVFEAARSGRLANTASTLSFSHEPAGVAINPGNGHLFFSDDNNKRVFEINLGLDKRLGTADDIMTSFSTTAFNCFDPEGLAFGAGQLFITDGVGKEVYVISPGANGIFDGVAPASDDRMRHFDTERLGQVDPEGIDFNTNSGTLYIISRVPDTNIVETTTSGSLVQVIDISSLGAYHPSGLAVAPGSVKPSTMNLYVTDRGIDNNIDPNENDGKVYEIKIVGSPATAIRKSYIPIIKR